MVCGNNELVQERLGIRVEECRNSKSRGTSRVIDTALRERLGAHGAREMAYEVPRWTRG